MKLAFCLFKFFPYGGLQRDFLRIAYECKNRGHDIHVYTMEWQGEPVADFKLHFIPIKKHQNYIKRRIFVNKLQQELKNNPCDLIIGFNKIPGLDFYYAADICFKTRMQQEKTFFHRYLPRYRQLLHFEHAVFAEGHKTKILLISALQQEPFRQCYQTESERFHLLPPGISKDRVAPTNAQEIRKKMRDYYQLTDEDFLLLMVGSGFKTKGLDRAIIALASLPPALRERCYLFVLGQDDPKKFQKLVRRYQIDKKIFFLGGKNEVLNFNLAADLLLHPAYHENTGTVLLEAMIAGLPVLTTDICGYAHYVKEANAGVVLTSPFQQSALNEAVEKMLLSDERFQWQQNGLAFATYADIYQMPKKAVDIIEQQGKQV